MTKAQRRYLARTLKEAADHIEAAPAPGNWAIVAGVILEDLARARKYLARIKRED